MKISYIIDDLVHINGGTEGQLYRLIQGMVENGHAVTLYVLRSSEFTEALHTFPCDIINLDIHSIISINSWRKLWSFRRRLTRDGCHVLHGFFNDVALMLPIFFLYSRIKRYTSRRDMGIWYTPLRLFLLRLFSLSNTHIICNSNAVATNTSKMEWKSLAKISVIYNGITPRPKTAGQEMPDWYQQPSLSQTALRCVLLANIRPVKRIQDLVKAAKIINTARVSMEFFVIGEIADLDYYNYLQDLIKENQLGAHFHFTGLLQEPRNYLHLFDIGVLTSESEGFSNAIMDYLDCGLPVIASRTGGNPELITHGEHGFLYDVGNSRQLSKYILRLANNDELRARLSSKAKIRIRQFDTPEMINRHEAVYSRC